MALPNGYRFAGIHCGIKPAKPDLALIVADKPAFGFGVYTQNLVRAACIDWNRAITPHRNFRGVLINSGNANACTGLEGQRNNRELAELVAQAIGDAQSDQFAIFSTGVIGQQLPMPKLRAGITRLVPELAASLSGFENASQAILTTDKGPKTGFESIQVGDSTYSIAAMAKGAGMIGPNMATMLGFVMTDFPVPFERGQSLLKSVIDRTFNRLSVEGHTSTNDGILLLAPASGPNGTESEAAIAVFESCLFDICRKVARKIPTDGEGASHLIHISVSGAPTDAEADRIARTIALSNLVKTAIAGADPNWGRIVSAAGYAGVAISTDEISLRINGLSVFDRGTPTSFVAAEVSRAIRDQFETEIALQVGYGPGNSEHWTSDLTVEYVKLNAEYTT